MRVKLETEVLGDGRVGLSWSTSRSAQCVELLIIRTGAVPSYTSLRLTGDTTAYEIRHLSRHQRYRFCVSAGGDAGHGTSSWVSVTPRAGLTPIDEGTEPIERHLARVERFLVMPQDRRLTAYWQRGPGFVDRLLLQVSCRGALVWEQPLEPEVRSVSVDAARGAALENGADYSVRLLTRFAALAEQPSAEVRCTPAPQGEERTANRGFAQDHLVYPFLALGEEVQIFDEPADAGPTVSAAPSISCGLCGEEVEWRGYRLRCGRCGAEFIPNGRGAYLDVARLRFGTCRCCLPKKILIQKAGAGAPSCAHSGKEHIRMPDQEGYLLIEDLPFGLCQCCRPRRPLVKQGDAVRCSKSSEVHRNEQGRYALAPSVPVFDARAIDDLLDEGLAEICASGVSRGRR